MVIRYPLYRNGKTFSKEFLKADPNEIKQALKDSIFDMNPESWTKNFRGFVMSKKRKKHGYAERLKYMHMLEKGLSINHIHLHYGIGKQLLSSLWIRYQSEGYSGLIKKKNVKADYAFKLQILRDIEENHLTLVAMMCLLVKYPNGKESLEFTAMMHCLSSGLKADHQRTIWEDHGKRNRTK